MEYVASGNGKGKIDYVENSNGNRKKNNYDEYGRVIQSTETIDGINYTSDFEYSQYGSLIKETYPGNFAVVYEYNDQGELRSIKRADNNQAIWYCQDYNENLQPTTVYLGANGSALKTTYAYDNFKRISSITLLLSGVFT